MNKTTEKLPGTRAVAQRIVNAEESFIELVMLKTECTKAQAEKVLRVYRKLKVVKLDPVGGVLSVKHGLFWEVEPLRNAINFAE